jgi:hypothetical protein
MANGLKSASFLMERWIAEAAGGDPNALYELGIAYSTGTGGIPVDLVEAHKWFNLAALNGSCLAQDCRAEIADEMSARENRRGAAPGARLACSDEPPRRITKRAGPHRPGFFIRVETGRVGLRCPPDLFHGR